MTLVILFVFGAIVGSFLNVVALRWSDLSFFSGRSKCPHCGKTLLWYELVPLLSFVIQGGKCRGCKAGISWQYPLVELFTGLIFITVPYWMIPVFCIYIAILIYDFYHKIIPDPLVYLAIALSILYILLNMPSYAFIDLLAGPILFFFFASIWYFSEGRAMGFGDAKLVLSVGLLLGAAQGFSAIVLAFWIGAFFALFLIWSKRFTMKSEIPFAPYIIAGAWISIIFNLDLLHVGSF